MRENQTLSKDDKGYWKLEEYINEKLDFKGAKRINYLRKVNSKAYAYVVTAVKLLGNELEEMEFIK